MQSKKYGEFDNFDDFLSDILSELDEGNEDESFRDDNIFLEEDAYEAEKTPDYETKEPHDVAAHKANSIQHKRNTANTAESHISDAKKPQNNRSVRNQTGGSEMRKSIPFLSVLAVLTVFAWVIPLRPTVSETEKRNLETFPEFSVSALVNGDYFQSIESWFSDTFTFRDSWIDLSDGFKKIYGIKSVVIYGDIPVADAIPIPSPVSDEESDEPASAEELDTDVSDAEITEEEAEAEQEPVSVDEYDETDWGGIELDEDILISDRDAKLQIGDSIFAYPGFNQNYAEKYAEAMNRAADLLEGKANLYSIIVPYSATAMLTRETREQLEFVNEEDAFEYMYSLMDDNVKKVNVIKNLQKHNSEYIYFRSDPHWTAVGAYYAYEKWCEVAGVEPVPLTDYEEIVWEDFFGTYYYTSGKPKEITDNPDSVHAFIPPGDVHLYLDFNNGDRLGSESDILLDRSVRKVDQYITFIGTDKAKATFINNSIDDESAVLVLKTSYGNPFVYYLTQHYHTVYVVDMRYYACHSITDFVDKFNVQDVIYIHSSSSCYFDQGYAMITKLIR